MARPKNPRYDESAIEPRVEEMKSSLSADIEGLPLIFLERNLEEAATLEAMMDSCKDVVHSDGLTRQERTGAANNRRVKIVPNANLDVYLKLLRSYISVTGAITKLTKPAAQAVEEDEDSDGGDVLGFIGSL